VVFPCKPQFIPRRHPAQAERLAVVADVVAGRVPGSLRGRSALLRGRLRHGNEDLLRTSRPELRQHARTVPARPPVRCRTTMPPRYFQSYMAIPGLVASPLARYLWSSTVGAPRQNYWGMSGCSSFDFRCIFLHGAAVRYVSQIYVK